MFIDRVRVHLRAGHGGAGVVSFQKLRGKPKGRAVGGSGGSGGVFAPSLFLGTMTGGITRAIDLESIEVLRGPQGTLFGRNTIGGAVKYVTRELPDETSLRLRGTGLWHGPETEVFARLAPRWEAIFGVIVPTAATGIFGALVLGLGRALGETMALAMLIGNAKLTQGADTFSSDRIVYDRVKSVVKAGAADYLEKPWQDDRLVVDRFMPERDGELYVLRLWMFFGDKEYCMKVTERRPMVKSRGLVSVELMDHVPAGVREVRQRPRGPSRHSLPPRRKRGDLLSRPLPLPPGPERAAFRDHACGCGRDCPRS